MEDPRFPSLNNQLNLSLDPTLTSLNAYPFPPQSSLTDSTFNNYRQPDIFSQSYLHPLPTFIPDDILFDGMPKSSHDDLNQFFNDAAFGGGTPGTGSRFEGNDKSQDPSSGSWQRSAQQSTPEWDQAGPLAVDTNAADKSRGEQTETLVKNGQVTPGDSPSSQKYQKGVRKTGRRTKATAKVEHAPAPSTSAQSSDAPAAPAKRVRKPRRSTKKPPTPEQEAAKRETFLKRNREAAYKCRIKKKTQTEMIIERAKQLDADNAVKGFEVEKLKREVEGLRAMLLPHWRACGDDNVGAYVDSLVNEGWRLGKMVMSLSGSTREPFEMEEEPREDDELNEDEFGPAHMRRRSEAVFEMSLQGFEESITKQAEAANRQRRESFFCGSLEAGELLKDALGSVGSISSSGSGTPAVMRPMDVLKEEFLLGDTPPPLDLSAPDGQ